MIHLGMCFQRLGLSRTFGANNGALQPTQTTSGHDSLISMTCPLGPRICVALHPKASSSRKTYEAEFIGQENGIVECMIPARPGLDNIAIFVERILMLPSYTLTGSQMGQSGKMLSGVSTSAHGSYREYPFRQSDFREATEERPITHVPTSPNDHHIEQPRLDLGVNWGSEQKPKKISFFRLHLYTASRTDIHLYY